MEFTQVLQTRALALVPTLIVVVLVLLVLTATSRITERRRIRTGEPRVLSQALMIGLAFAGSLVIILVLPVSDITRGQLYTLVSVLVSASIALSSSTIVGNAMAGLLIRLMSGSRVRPGDYVRVDQHVGRVTEMGILHTMIQTETRDVTWLPNLWIVGQAVTLRQRSGTIVNTTVSLGYDVDRGSVQAALLEAANAAGLAKPFVRIEDLGDFSITYKVGGLLTDLTQLLETHSQLRGAVLDALHGVGIEIVSPVVETSRVFSSKHVFVPRTSETTILQEGSPADEIMFDQATAAAASHEEREALRAEYEAALSHRDAAKNPVDRLRLTPEVERLAKLLAQLDG